MSTERTETTQRRSSTAGNLLTAVLTVCIIAAGLLTPTLAYPQLDHYRNQITILAEPASVEAATYIFPEPVSLYPWNLAATTPSLQLTGAQQGILYDKGVPGYLLAALRDRGMEPPEDLGSATANIMSSFRFLDVPESIGADCFVLVDADINGDGSADLDCAADENGNIISLRLRADEWEDVSLVALAQQLVLAQEERQAAQANALAQSAAAQANAPQANAPAPGAATQEANAAESQGESQAANSPTTAGTPPPTDAAATAADATAAGATANTPTAQNTTPAAQTPSFPPDADLHIWSFVYATVREARAAGQTALAEHFALLDGSYRARYGYSFEQLLPGVSVDEPQQATEAQSSGTKPSGAATEPAPAVGAATSGATSPTAGAPTGATSPTAGAATSGAASPTAGAATPSSLEPAEEPTILTPTVFATEDYLLYIYDPPTGVRIALYLDTAGLHCLGFTLLFTTS